MIQRILAALFCFSSVACMSPAESPWGESAPGRVGVSLWPALATEYDVRGSFVRGEVIAGTGSEESRATGTVEGKFGLAGEVAVTVWRDLSLAAGADYRRYGVEGLDPIDSPDFVRVSVDTVDSLQYYLAARYDLPPSRFLPGLRPYLQAGVSYLPTFDFDYNIEFQGPLADDNDDLALSSSGDGVWFFSFGAGLKYWLSERVSAQLGAIYELPLTHSDADLSFDVGTLLSVPLTADLYPEGIVFQGGLTLYL